MLRSIRSRLLLLALVPLVATTILAAWLFHRSTDRLIEQGAVRTADIVSNQVLFDRKHYTSSVVEKLKGTEFAAREGYTPDAAHVPLPATFINSVAADSNSRQDEYRYGLVSRWAINPDRGLADDFLVEGFSDLMLQEAEAKRAGTLTPDRPFDGWRPFYEVSQRDGRAVLRYLRADVGSADSCVTCHDGLERRPEIQARRRAAGVEVGRTFERNDLIGAIVVEIDMEEAGALASSSLSTTLLCLGGVCVAAGLIGLFVGGRFVQRPLLAVVKRVREISEGDGDLTARLDERGAREFVELARWGNAFLERMQATVRDVAAASTDLDEQAARLRAAGGAVEGLFDHAVGVTSSVSSSASGIDDDIRGLAETSHELEIFGRRVAEEVRTTTGIADDAVRTATSTSEIIERLRGGAEEIGGVIDVINMLAEQVNLLALNATIEAARAGEAGRGFAVVASEVKHLAGQTADATRTISARVQSIQSSALDVGTVLEQVCSTIASIHARQRSVGQEVERQGDTTTALARLASAIASSSSSIAEDIAGIARDSEEVAEAVRESLAAAELVRARAGRLKQLVAGYRFE